MKKHRLLASFLIIITAMGMMIGFSACQNPFLLNLDESEQAEPAQDEGSGAASGSVEEGKAISPDENGSETDAASSGTGAENEKTAQSSSGETVSVAGDGALKGCVVCLDPGHGITSESRQEAVSPLSSETKPAYVSGAEGRYQTEEELNLAVAEILRDKLEADGASVVMTRTTHEATVSNIERAQMANQAGADLCVRIHADGSENKTAHGISILIPAGSMLGTPSIQAQSREAAESVRESLLAATGASDRGLVERTDLTGFNWSEVPVILVEMGFLSNEEEDRKMAQSEYREQLAEGMFQGIRRWLLE